MLTRAGGILNTAGTGIRAVRTGEAIAAMPRKLFQRFDTQQPASTAAVDLYSNSIPDFTLSTNGDALHVVYGMVLAANTNRKRGKVMFAGTNFIEWDSSGDAVQPAMLWLDCYIVRTSNAAVIGFGTVTHHIAGTTAGSVNQPFAEIASGLDLDETAYDMKLNVRAYTTNTDITARYAECWYHPAV